MDKTETHPKGFKFIFFGELAERSSYYGMMCLLASYLMDQLSFSEAKTGVVMHGFKAGAYILPLLGGYIADRWLGKFKTVIVFALPYIAGHFIIGEFQTEHALYLALFLLACGAGVIKPNVLPLMGLMYEREGKSPALFERATSYYYLGINIGAIASMTTLPWVRTHYGYSAAFMAPTILMAASLAVFYFGKKYYPAETKDTPLSDEPPPVANTGAVLANLAGVFVCITFFFFVYDQQNTTWVFLAKKMELYGHDPDWLQWLNGALIIVFIPLFNVLWEALGKRNMFTRSTDKMLLGFSITTLCMLTLAIPGWAAAKGGHPSLWWQVAAYVLLGMAEMCISVVGLSFTVEESPANMKSTVMAVFLGTVFFGNLLAGWASTYYATLGPGDYFFFLSAVMMAITVFFWFVARSFHRRKLQMRS